LVQRKQGRTSFLPWSYSSKSMIIGEVTYHGRLCQPLLDQMEASFHWRNCTTSTVTCLQLCALSTTLRKLGRHQVNIPRQFRIVPNWLPRYCHVLRGYMNWKTLCVNILPFRFPSSINQVRMIDWSDASSSQCRPTLHVCISAWGRKCSHRVLFQNMDSEHRFRV
jgi:hypothetical protein